MAVDMIARRMALDAAQQGGTGDAYTKAEIDAMIGNINTVLEELL